MQNTPRFISSYQGSSTYEMPNTFASDGMLEVVEVRVRAFTDCNPFTSDHFAQSIVPSVGTIRRYHGVSKWPSEAACLAFSQFVPARYNPDTKSIEYRDGRVPVVSTDQFGLVFTEVA